MRNALSIYVRVVVARGRGWSLATRSRCCRRRRIRWNGCCSPVWRSPPDRSPSRSRRSRPASRSPTRSSSRRRCCSGRRRHGRHAFDSLLLSARRRPRTGGGSPSTPPLRRSSIWVGSDSVLSRSPASPPLARGAQRRSAAAAPAAAACAAIYFGLNSGLIGHRGRPRGAAIAAEDLARALPVARRRLSRRGVARLLSRAVIVQQSACSRPR